MATVVASDVGGGSVMGGKQRSEGEGGPESEGEVRGGRGCVASREGPGKEEAARQGGGGRGAWPRAPPSSFGARGRKTTGGVEMGWAVLGQVSGRQVTSFSLSLLFLFDSVFYFL